MGGHGELADPERKELIQRVNTLLKVITILLNPVRAPKKTFSLPVGQVIVCTFHQMIFNFADSLLDLLPINLVRMKSCTCTCQRKNPLVLDYQMTLFSSPAFCCPSVCSSILNVCLSVCKI